jgi:L-asparaginase
MATKPRIAHLAGPVATMQNTPPLVTSNKARKRHGLPLATHPDGSAKRYDALRPQRLASPVKVYVEQFSAHPLEADAAELYGPPDGFVGADGVFRQERRMASDKPVYEMELHPDDGPYPLPYMAVQADGQPWEEECAEPGAPEARARQAFFPDGSRSFELIDRLEVTPYGTNDIIAGQADVDFYRILPPSGYTKGLPQSRRTDRGDGDIAPERRGRDFFPYRPHHLSAMPTRASLARLTNAAQRVVASGQYDGAMWTEGSPSIEETSYWLNLLLDTTLPVCGCAAQRPQGSIANDGPKNIVDCIEYLTSRVWADPQGRNKAGVVLVQVQRVFAAREVQKVDARPGGYVATGGHGGILGGVGFSGTPVLLYVPTTRHTWLSEVNIARLPHDVAGLRGTVQVKNQNDALLETAMPKVAIVKDGSYMAEEPDDNPEDHPDLLAIIEDATRRAPLAGFVVEAYTPYGLMSSKARQALMLRAIYSGMPVARVGRGNPQGFVPRALPFIASSNLTATKARLLLMACVMRFGALPRAVDPMHPTAAERTATERAVSAYQDVFATH